jgi:hypothetical protein
LFGSEMTIVEDCRDAPVSLFFQCDRRPAIVIG